MFNAEIFVNLKYKLFLYSVLKSISTKHLVSASFELKIVHGVMTISQQIIFSIDLRSL